MNLSDKTDKQASQKKPNQNKKKPTKTHHTQTNNPQTKQKPIKHLSFFLVPVNTEERKNSTFLSIFST